MFSRKPPLNRNRPKLNPTLIRGANRTATPTRFNLRAWREQHGHSLFSSLRRLAARPWATALTVLVMGLALALPLLFFLVLNNARGLSTTINEGREVRIFLKPELTSEATQQILEHLRLRNDIATIDSKSPDQGLNEFRQQYGFADALKVLPYNPLPTVLLVTLREAVKPDHSEPPLIAELKADTRVDLVQYDAEWHRRLSAILNLVERAVQILAGLLALGTLLVVGNSIRLDIHSRADEIVITRLLGASNGFVRRPFLYTGLWYGALSGGVAIVIVVAVEYALTNPLAQLLASYDYRFGLYQLSINNMLTALSLSTLLGWFGAWLTSSRYLTQEH